MFDEQRVLFAADPEAADKLLKVGEMKTDAPLDKAELAAGTVLANALLNHDQAIMLR
jgi:hypothetical protein